VEKRGARRLTLGRVAGIPVHVSPTWFLVAAVITIGFEPIVADYLPGLGRWSYAVTLAFAVLLYASVLLHEISHALTARAFGLPVRSITIHFLGGHTEIERESPTPGRDALVSGAGPLVSIVLGVLAYLVAIPVEAGVAEFLLLELAVANVIVGLFNLLPALPLDGGHMLRALIWKITGDETRGTLVAARAGQVLAVAVLASPFLLAGGAPSLTGIVWAALIAMLLWSGAAQSLAVGRMRSRLPLLDPRSLARPAAPVSADLPVSEALRRADDAGARSMVIVDSAGRPIGIVSQAAVAALPDERRPWVSIDRTARTLDTGLTLPLDLHGEDLLKAMRAHPASEYLVVDPQGRVFGVLATSDVEAVLAPV
jgi:Zn-dependent protease